MEMGGKECARTEQGVIMDILNNGPCEGEAIIGTGSTSDFIEN